MLQLIQIDDGRQKISDFIIKSATCHRPMSEVSPVRKFHVAETRQVSMSRHEKHYILWVARFEIQQTVACCYVMRFLSTV